MLKHVGSTIKAARRGQNLVARRCFSDYNDSAHSSKLSDEEFLRKCKTEWKRRQKGQSFLDSLIMTVRGGQGGDGCVAFHREKFMPYGPPSGGNGGRGGDVYIQACPRLTTLASVPKRVRGGAGGHGKGTWMHGKTAKPTIIKVPIGTVVRELGVDDSRRTRGEEVDDWRPMRDGDTEGGLAEEAKNLRQKRWLHYPGAEADNLGREAFKEAEKMVYRLERERRMLEREERIGPIFLDLDSSANSANKDTPSTTLSPDSRSPPSTPNNAVFDPTFGHLLARGGPGGLGNPAFLSPLPQLHARSPKFATRGSPGHLLTLHLELKLLADVGLVGFPNAGKSTLLRALTGGRSKTEVAGYAFTTVNPVVGVVRLGLDGGILGGEAGGLIVRETREEELMSEEGMSDGTFTQVDPDKVDDAIETFRFTLADNPGLIAESSQNRGLGHSFLRSIERALALAYVVDFAGPHPERELLTLREELDTYKQGLSNKARVVVLNKADLLGREDDCDGPSVEEAKEKLERLKSFVKMEMAVEVEGKRRQLDIVPISAKYSQNVSKLVALMRTYVEEERRRAD